MLELQLPRSMPHALPREPPFDFHFSSSARPTTTKFDSSTIQMQLPVPRMSNGYELPAPRRPLTPPDVPGSAVKVVSLPQSQGDGPQYGYQLPAIGNSRSATATTSPSAQRQTQQQLQEVAQTPRKKWSISPNLRIPSTISTPQEGLPQLAAEVSVYHDDSRWPKTDRSRLLVCFGSKAQRPSTKSQTRPHLVNKYSPSFLMRYQLPGSANGWQQS